MGDKNLTASENDLASLGNKKNLHCFAFLIVNAAARKQEEETHFHIHLYTFGSHQVS